MPGALRTFNKKHLTVNFSEKLSQLSIVNCQLFRKGFTLIELLVVLGILVIGVGSTLLFLTSTLRGTNQANVTAEVKQNGQAVLDSLDRLIRNATDASTDATGKYLKLSQPSTNPLHIKCFADGPLPKVSNGWIGTVTWETIPSDGQYVSITNKDDAVSGVDIQDCNFTVYAPTTTSPAAVKLSFTIYQGVGAPSRQDFLANAKFETTISLRKY